MPLILKPGAYYEWLDPDNKEPAKIEELLRTNYVKELKRYSGPSGLFCEKLFVYQYKLDILNF